MIIKNIISTTHLDLDNQRFAKSALIQMKNQLNNKSMNFYYEHNNKKERIGFSIIGSARIKNLEGGEFGLEIKAKIENKEEYNKIVKKGGGISIAVKVGENKDKGDISIPYNISDIYEGKNGKIFILDDYKSFYEDIGFSNISYKNNLTLIDNIYLLEQGGLKFGGYILNYSNLFKRGFYYKSAYNDRLINSFKDMITNNPKIKFGILLEKNEIMSQEDYRIVLEKSYWYGIKELNLEKLNEGISRFNQDGKIIDISTFLNKKENLVEIEIEEIPNEVKSIEEGENKGLYPLRYFHLQYSYSINKIIHFDGAIRFYNSSSIKTRIDNKYSIDISKTPKELSKRIKLFRVDGEINIKDTFNILINYFWGDNDIREYFNKYIK